VPLASGTGVVLCWFSLKWREGALRQLVGQYFRRWKRWGLSGVWDAEQHLADEVSQGLLGPTVSSEVKRLSCAFSRERILLCCIRNASTDLCDLAG